MIGRVEGVWEGTLAGVLKSEVYSRCVEVYSRNDLLTLCMVYGIHYPIIIEHQI